MPAQNRLMRSATIATAFSLTATAFPQSVSLHLDADRATARPGDVVTWTVTASFTGFDDPTAYFGSFAGELLASDDGLAFAQHPLGLLASAGGVQLAGASIFNIDVSNAAWEGTDDPTNPIPIFSFATGIRANQQIDAITFTAAGTASVFPSAGSISPFVSTDFMVSSDIVRIHGARRDRLSPSTVSTGNTGGSVAFGETHFAIGVGLDDTIGEWAGAVYVYDNGTNQLAYTLYPPAGSEFTQFGEPIAITGDRLLVSQTHHFSNDTDEDVVWVYDLPSGTLTGELRGVDITPDEQFGRALAADGDIAVVGSHLADRGGLRESGAVFVFDLTTNQLLGELAPTKRRISSLFGHSVAADDGVCVVGARGESSVRSNAGAAYIFDLDTRAQTARLVPENPDPFEYYGISVALDSGRAFVAGDGTVDCYDASTGQLVESLSPLSGVFESDFPRLAAGDGSLIVGNPFFGPNAGRAWRYDIASLAQTEVHTSDVNELFLGGSSALGQGRSFVARIVDNPDSERVYVFEIDSPPFEPCDAVDVAEPFGVLDIADLMRLIEAFTSGHPLADLNADGLYDLTDIAGIVVPFSEPCGE